MSLERSEKLLSTVSLQIKRHSDCLFEQLIKQIIDLTFNSRVETMHNSIMRAIRN